MKIPETVFVCGIPHKVSICKDHFDTDTHMGDIRYAECLIQINDKMPFEMQVSTLIHEMVHGILVGIGRNDLTTDEAFVCSLANAINNGFEVRGING